MKKFKILSCILASFCLATYITTNASALPTTSASINDTNSYQETQFMISDKEKSDLLNGKLSVDEFLSKHPEIRKTKEDDLKESKGKLNNKNNQISTFGNILSEQSRSLSGSFNALTNWNSYGGDQGWFIGTSQSYINDYGCGSVTASNIMAYHAKYYNRSALFPYSYDKSGFMNSIRGMYNSYIIAPTILTDMTNGLKRYTTDKGYRYGYSTNSCWSSSSSTFSNLMNMVQSNINANNPIALLCGPKYTSSSTDDFSNHWVTVTGYRYTTDGKHYITVSSWGEQYELELYQLATSKLFVDIAVFYNY